MNYCTGLQCSMCGKLYSSQKAINTCDCGFPLLPTYNLEAAAEKLLKKELAQRKNNIWRYRELLPIDDDSNIVSLGESCSPVLQIESIGKQLGHWELYLKDEGRFPGGSFKARGAAVGVSKAKELGIKKIAIPTAGNAGGVWAAYGAKAGMEVFVVMPADAPEINKKEAIAYGAHVYLVDGFISDAAKIVAKICKNHDIFPVSTFEEPYRVDGKKTLGLEIVEQFNWQFPEVILYPCGGGVGLAGIWKAFKELKAMGWVEGNGPRMVAVQSDGCAPVVSAFRQNLKRCKRWDDADTVADGLRVPKPLADTLILETIYESNGCAVAVNEDHIKKMMLQLARAEGILSGPEGAATLLSIEQLIRSKWVSSSDRILVISTATGLKYHEIIMGEPQHLAGVSRIY